MANVLDLLKPDGYIMANKKIIKMFGLHEAILLGSLCSRQSMWNDYYKSGRWDESQYGKYEGFFYCTAESLECETTLSAYLQRNAFKNLEDQGLIETKLKGLPATKWFRVNEKKLVEIFLNDEDEDDVNNNSSNSLTTSCEKPSQLDVKDLDGNNNKENNNKKENSYISGVSNATATETKETKENDDDVYDLVKDVIEYLNEKTGSRYRSKSGVVNRYIIPRINEGYTLEDFKKVIDNKVADWKGTDMEQFIRPSTLFAPSHFEDYLNQVVTKKVDATHAGKPSTKWDGKFYGDKKY